MIKVDLRQFKVHFYGNTDGFPVSAVLPGGAHSPAVTIFSIEDFFYNLHPEDKPILMSQMKSFIEGSSDIMKKPYRRCSPEGGCRWVKCRAQLCRDPENEPEYLFVSEIDVTEYENVERKLRDTLEVVQREHEQAESLRQIAAAISSSLNMGETVDRILEETKRVIPYDMGTVQLLRRNELEVIGGVGFSNKEEILKMRFPYPEEGSLSTTIVTLSSLFFPMMSQQIFPDLHRRIQIKRCAPGWASLSSTMVM
ncbi:MAG: PAS domain-containing protein [Spirochaetales bacterium]|nr:PAS domain-containing protein [Spirochaetales bacterium]